MGFSFYMDKHLSLVIRSELVPKRAKFVGPTQCRKDARGILLFCLFFFATLGLCVRIIINSPIPLINFSLTETTM
jgi:hypothetical protein